MFEVVIERNYLVAGVEGQAPIVKVRTSTYLSTTFYAYRCRGICMVLSIPRALYGSWNLEHRDGRAAKGLPPTFRLLLRTRIHHMHLYRILKFQAALLRPSRAGKFQKQKMSLLLRHYHHPACLLMSVCFPLFHTT